MPKLNFDVDQLIGDIKTSVSDVLEKDITTLRGFSERQLKALALQGKLIAEYYAKGEISSDEVDYFLDNLEDMAQNFANTLRGLSVVTIEKVWNAVVGVLTKAIGASLKGVGLAIPGI